MDHAFLVYLVFRVLLVDLVFHVLLVDQVHRIDPVLLDAQMDP
jgi:hypothetical protein